MNKFLLLIFVLLIKISSLSATEISDFIDKRKCNQIIDKEIYTVCYSYKYKGALGGWTRLDGEKVNAESIKKRPRFYENKSIPEKYRTKYSDYTGIGETWNRGHFIISDADADYSQESLNLVYDMSQIQPQASMVNQKTWLKVERYGRVIATKLRYVNSITIANYKNANKTIKNNIVVPSGFYRIYYNDEANFKKCFYYKNDPHINPSEDKLKEHIVDCGSVQNFVSDR